MLGTFFIYLLQCAFPHNRVKHTHTHARARAHGYHALIEKKVPARSFHINSLSEGTSWRLNFVGTQRLTESHWKKKPRGKTKYRRERDGNWSDYTWLARIYRWVELRLRLARTSGSEVKNSPADAHRSTMNRESDRACHTNDVAVNCCLSMCYGRSQLP